MSRSGMPSRTRMRPPRFRTKDVSTCMGSPTARGSSSPSHSSARMLPSLKRTRSAPRNSTRFAARYPAHGLPCERFKLSLAASPCITRGRSGWLGLTPRRTFTSYPSPAFLAHSAWGHFRHFGCLGQVGLTFNNGTQRDPIESPFCVTSSGTFREVGSAPQAVADNVISLPLLGT
jgi:hypothetical protein